MSLFQSTIGLFYNLQGYNTNYELNSFIIIHVQLNPTKINHHPIKSQLGSFVGATLSL